MNILLRILSYGAIMISSCVTVNADSNFMPVKGLVHRYPTKVLVFPSNNCGTFCRYCFRKKFVGEKETQLPRSELEPIFDYLQSHPEINEVIFRITTP